VLWGAVISQCFSTGPGTHFAGTQKCNLLRPTLQPLTSVLVCCIPLPHPFIHLSLSCILLFLLLHTLTLCRCFRLSLCAVSSHIFPSWYVTLSEPYLVSVFLISYFPSGHTRPWGLLRL
jgi:hypothetical protein